MSAPESIEERVQAHLSGCVEVPVRVREITPLHGGACQENLRVELEIGDLEIGGEARTMALRRDAASSIKGSLSRRVEYPVIRAAVENGVKTPQAHWLWEEDGVSSYFMDWADGVALGRAVVASPDLKGARRVLPAQLAGQLARIHSITPQTHADLPIGALATEFDGDPVESALRGVRAMFEEFREPHPALALAYDWLDCHRPPPGPVVLCHGDFRTGNFLVGPQGLNAVVDWEFAHWGAPEEDIAWLCVRDWRFGRRNRPVGGFSDRETFYGAYAEATGRDVDPETVRYWEIFGNVRWAAGCVYQGERYLSGAQKDLQLIAIARRSAEMEWEALRLIEHGGD